VSIVIVVYGNWAWVDRTLGAVREQTRTDYEVIVVDNASPDDTLTNVERAFDGLVIIRNERNAGFGVAANRGAARALGKYLCFLNSDVTVEPNWLEPMVDLLERRPDVGVVAPMFLNLDGTLQEAGGLVGREGSIIRYGCDGDASRFEYRFRREVDYGSGACLLVRRRDFHAVGGFDARYGVGYFEDVDLCSALAAVGLSTVYEPAARVTHAGGVSGDSTQQWELFHRNHRLFIERWGPRLVGRVPFAGADYYWHREVAARDHMCLDRILVVATDLGHTGQRDQWAAYLAEVTRIWPSARVTLALLDGLDDPDAATRFLEQGIEVAAAPDWSTWFEQRWFHYSLVVVATAAAGGRVGALLHATQPQAVVVPVRDGARSNGGSAAPSEVVGLGAPPHPIVATMPAPGLPPPASE